MTAAGSASGGGAVRSGPVPSADAADPPVAHGAANGASRAGASDRIMAEAARRGVPLATIVAGVGVVAVFALAAVVVYRLRQLLLLFAVAGFVALLLNPLVALGQRVGRAVAGRHRRLRFLERRGVSVGLVTAAALVVFAGLAAAFGYPLVRAVTHFVTHLNSYVSAAEHGRGAVGRLVRRYHVASWVRRNAPKLESYAKALAHPALSIGKGAVSLVVALVALFMLVLLLLLEGPRLRTGALSLVSSGHRERVLGVASSVAKAVTGYMLGNLLTSVAAGIVVAATMAGLGLPYPALWGLWVALVDFLPMVGGLLAGLPAVLFALVVSGIGGGVVVLVVFLAYSLVENHVLNPLVMSATVRISPLLVLVAVLVGAELGDSLAGIFGGFVGTLLAIPVAGSAQVLVRELRSGRPSAETGDRSVP